MYAPSGFAVFYAVLRRFYAEFYAVLRRTYAVSLIRTPISNHVVRYAFSSYVCTFLPVLARLPARLLIDA